MGLLQSVTVYLVIALFLLIAIFVAAIVIFVLVRRKKTSISEVYYDSFDKHDSMEYLKFDEIVSSDENDPLKGAGVIVINQRTFVAGLNVVGYNFFTSSFEQQRDTIGAFIAMMDSLENPVSFRQNVKAINISHNISVFENRSADIEREINELKQRQQEEIADAEDYMDIDDDAADEHIKRAGEYAVLIERKKRLYKESERLVRYMKSISVDSGDTQKEQTLLFSYVYDNTQFTNQLSKEEIYLQAMTELSNRANSLIENLFNCNCTARRCTAEELVNLMRRHMHPATADDDSLSELFHSDIGSLFVTSTSLLDVIKEQMTNEEYERIYNELNEKIAEAEKQKRLQAERAKQDMFEAAERVARETIQVNV